MSTPSPADPPNDPYRLKTVSDEEREAALTRWFPQLEVLGKLFETASAVSDSDKTLDERVDAIEAAAAAADAWRTYLRDFLEVEIRARWEESRRRREFTATALRSEQWQALPVEEKKAWLLRDAYFDQRTGDISGIAQRMGEQHREAAGIKYEERWAVCPLCAMNNGHRHGDTMPS